MGLKILAIAACLLSASALAAEPGLTDAQNKMKQCAANWQQMKADGKTQGQDYKTYSASCLKAEAAPAKPQNAMKACAEQWNQLKADNKTNGQTYKQFSASCLKK